jgi:hypothetical protein
VASTYLGRFGDNSVTDDVEIGFTPPGDTGKHDAPCSGMLQARMAATSQAEGIEQTGLSSTRSVFPDFCIIGKLLHY